MPAACAHARSRAAAAVMRKGQSHSADEKGKDRRAAGSACAFTLNAGIDDAVHFDAGTAAGIAAVIARIAAAAGQQQSCQ